MVKRKIMAIFDGRWVVNLFNYQNTRPRLPKKNYGKVLCVYCMFKDNMGNFSKKRKERNTDLHAKGVLVA